MRFVEYKEIFETHPNEEKIKVLSGTVVVTH